MSYDPNMSTAARQSSGWRLASVSVMKPPYERPITPARSMSIRSSFGSTSCIAKTWSSRSLSAPVAVDPLCVLGAVAVEPRTFGTNTAKPSSVSAWISGIENHAKFGRSWLCGPPWT